MCARVCVHVCPAQHAGCRGKHAVLTAVGELHSLTDWQVSDASEEAELVDFWEGGLGGGGSGGSEEIRRRM